MSAHALLSPSAAARWLNCTPSPRLEESLAESPSVYAAEGSLAHEVCELVAKKKFTVMNNRPYNAALKKLKAAELWDNEMVGTAQVYVDHLYERYMSFDHAPYVALEVKVDLSDYAPDAFGTCDCIMIGGDELTITDYKHGRGVPVFAKDNAQMMLYALGALKQFRAIYGDAIQTITMCIDQPRLASYSVHTLTASELLGWGDNTVKPRAAMAYAGEGEFAPGEWCRFCRVKTCRARANTYTALADFRDAHQLPGGSVTADLLTGAPTPPLMSDAEIGELLRIGEGLVSWYNSVRDYALSTCLAGGTIPGWKVVEGVSRAAFAPSYDVAMGALIASGFDRSTLYKQVPETLSALDRLVGGRPKLQELLGDHLYTPPGKPTLVPESNMRATYNAAASDFTNMEKER